MGRDADVIRELTADHREVERLFEMIEAVPSHDPERKRLVDALAVELVRLAVAEEECVLPVVRERLPDGPALADKELHDLGNIERILAALEVRDAGTDDFDRLVAALEDEVRRHERGDEEGLFVELRRNCPERDLAAMGDEVRRVTRYARTRPHLQTVETPPEYELLSTESVRFVDGLRALFRRRRSD
ncbi:MAG TPA: hemerythrin domain-containing protein [Yinghuangia sp.]|nr:hemerythrin domain-containing protein [Yinghuangia sp.]